MGGKRSSIVAGIVLSLVVALPAGAAPSAEFGATLVVDDSGSECVFSGGATWKRQQVSQIDFQYLISSGSATIGLPGGTYNYSPAKPKGSADDSRSAPRGSAASIVARVTTYDASGALIGQADSPPVTAACGSIVSA